jgi:AraC-like DNA-binding protein
MQASARYTVEEQVCIPSGRRVVREKRYLRPAVGVVLSGSFEYRSQGGGATAVPGSVIFGNSAEYFRCYPRDRIGNRRQVVCFDQVLLDEVAQSCGFASPCFQVAAIPPGRLAGSVFGSMRRLALRPVGHEEAAYDLAEAALRICVPTAVEMPISARNKQRVLAIVKHLERYYCEPWTLQTLAGLARLSPCYFLRLFRTVTGQSPTQYLLNARLRAAANDLLTTRAPVGQIALRIGFNDISHFNASFRGMFGRTPTHWRQ